MRRKIKYNSEAEWLKLREDFIGASEVAILTGNNTYQNPSDLYNRKVNKVETPVNERMRWGNLLEDAIAKEWATRNNRKVRRSNFLYVYEDILAATIDRLDDLGRVIEIKNMSSFAFNNSFKIEGVPAIYYDQMQAQMLCTGITEGVFVALINNGELYESYISYNDEYAMEMFKNVKDFVENHWRPQIPPEQKSEIIEEINESSIEGSKEDYLYFDKIKTLELAIKDLTQQKNDIIGKIKDKMGNNKELIYNGKKLFYYDTYYQFNSSNFKKDYPELYESYKNQLVTKFNIAKL